MTENNMQTKRTMVLQIMKYVSLAVILAYIVVLMVYASGSSKPFEEVEA